MKYNLQPRTFRLDIWRQNNNQTLRQTSKICKVSYSYLSRVESKKCVASPSVALRIFKSLQRWESKNNKIKIYTNFADLIIAINSKE